MSKAKIIQWGAKLFGFGTKAAKTSKKVVKIVPKTTKSNKSVAALSKSIDKFKTSAASRKIALAKKTTTAAANAKKIKDAAIATKKAETANKAVITVNNAKKAGTKKAADVKKITDAAAVANALAKKTANAKRLAEKAVATKKADFAKKVVAGRKVVVTKNATNTKKVTDTKKTTGTKKAAETTESKVKDNSYSGTNTDTRAGKVAAYAGKKADAIGKGVAGVIKAPVKGARYIYRNPKKAIIPTIVTAFVADRYNQNRKQEAILKLLEKKNKKPKTIFDKNLEKADTTGQAAYLKKQALKIKNNYAVDSSAYKKAQAHLDSLRLLQKKNKQ